MGEHERSGTTTRYEPAGTVRRVAAQVGPRACHAAPARYDERELFADNPGLHPFATGGSGPGGSAIDGNYAVSDPNPKERLCLTRTSSPRS